MKNMMNIGTMEDAKTFSENSGLADWNWDGNATFEGFTEFIYKNYNVINRDDYNNIVKKYLLSVGENPADYNL